MAPKAIETFKRFLDNKLDTTQLDEIEVLLKSITNNDYNYIKVRELLEMFEESAPLAEAESLSQEVINIIKTLIEYLNDNYITIEKLLNDIIEDQNLSEAEEDTIIKVVNSEEFYKILKNIDVLQDENSELTEFLKLSEDSYDKFSLEKIKGLVKYVTDTTNDY